jgi:carbon-monoxide dehydrogenase small subunit
MKIALRINGSPREADVPPHRSLLETLRDNLGLTGTKECCSVGECGACTVLLNERAVNSCLVLGVEADGCEVTTIEGLAIDGHPGALQQAFVDHGAVQCGFCIPGMIMAAEYLLRTNPDPTEADVKEALVGNLCRCAAYSRIVDAVFAAARIRT